VFGVRVGVRLIDRVVVRITVRVVCRGKGWGMAKMMSCAHLVGRREVL